MRLGEHQKEVFEAHPETTTSPRMELTAVIKGLQALTREGLVVEVYSDSRYVVDGINRGWVERWKINGWQTAKKRDVENIDLWEELYAEVQKHNVTFIWTEGHASDEMNNLAHALAYAVCRGMEWKEEGKAS